MPVSELYPVRWLWPVRWLHWHPGRRSIVIIIVLVYDFPYHVIHYTSQTIRRIFCPPKSLQNYPERFRFPIIENPINCVTLIRFHDERVWTSLKTILADEAAGYHFYPRIFSPLFGSLSSFFHGFFRYLYSPALDILQLIFLVSRHC